MDDEDAKLNKNLAPVASEPSLSGQSVPLNKEQVEAIEYGEGPLLIIAGAGTGKTTVVTERIKWLISQNLAKPAEILALTFTDKAAREMETRVDVAMPYGYTQMWISTFHSFCDRILRAEAVQIGLDPGYKLMTEAETIIFLRQNLFKFNLNYFRPLGNPNKFLEGIIQHFSRLKDEDVNTEEYLHFAQSQKVKAKVEKEEVEKTLELAKAYQKYEELKIKEGVADFADLITNALKLFRTRPNIIRDYRKQFKYILVDEFQDTNIAQYTLLKIMAPPKLRPNLTVVGDDSQSIYKFRGAAVSNILQFMKDYKGAKQVVLTKNYRSSQTILDHAYRLIKHNDPDTLEVKLGISKNLKKMRQVAEEKIEFLPADRVEKEADLVAGRIKDLAKSKKYAWSDFAILMRANSHADPFVRAFARAGIPYQFLGPGMLFRQSEVKDLIAYLKILYNLEDSVALYRILTMDFFEISARDLATLTSFSKKTNLSLFETCEVVTGQAEGQVKMNIRPVVSEKTKEKLEKIVKMIYRHLKLLPKETAGQILYYFLEDTGLLRKMTEYKTAQDEKKAQNVSKFFDKLKTYEVDHEDASVSAVVDWIEMSMELGESPLAQDLDWVEVNAVNLLTVHSSKGLEFPVVFLVNLVAQRFPTTERREQIPIPEDLIKEILPLGDYHLEEERRLFYVGMTRARDRLILTAANYYGEGKRERKISPFVSETLGEQIANFKSALELTKTNQLSFLDWQKSAEISQKTPLAKINYLSFSQIDTFVTCPLQYRYRFIQRIPVPLSGAQTFGEVIHKTLNSFYRLVLDGKKPRFEDLLQLLKYHWLPFGYSSKAHEERMEKRGEKMLQSFFEKFYDPKILPKSLEQIFTVRLSPNLKIGGRIDRADEIGGKLEVIDYKTGKVPSEKEIKESLQMSIYALAATSPAIYGKKPEEVVLTFYFLEGPEKLSSQRTEAQLGEVKTKLERLAKEIENSPFSPTPGPWCDFCDFRLICEAWQ